MSEVACWALLWVSAASLVLGCCALIKEVCLKTAPALSPGRIGPGRCMERRRIRLCKPLRNPVSGEGGGR